MKVVIFAGGIGTRISEESYLKPKPMIEIGEKPILWHLMKIFEAQGFNDFIICVGYKSYVIKEYFPNYYVYNSGSFEMGKKVNQGYQGQFPFDRYMERYEKWLER